MVIRVLALIALAATIHTPVEDGTRLKAMNVEIKSVSYRGLNAVRVLEHPSTMDPLQGRRVDRLRAPAPEAPKQCRTPLPQNGDLAMGARESGSAQAVLHVLRSDCQQISAQPSERNASWMSARLSYRMRRRRN